MLLTTFLASGTTPLTYTVALTVVISAIVARLVFGKAGLFGDLATDAQERGRFFPGGQQVWVVHQQGLLQSSVLGLGCGSLAGWIVSVVPSPRVANVTVLMFGISAVSLLMLQFGFDGPVTHHMSLPGAVGAAAVVAVGAPAGFALLAGAAAGIAGALLGEVYSRLFLIHGDTHVDPPAIAIATIATVVVLIQLATGAV